MLLVDLLNVQNSFETFQSNSLYIHTYVTPAYAGLASGLHEIIPLTMLDTIYQLGAS